MKIFTLFIILTFAILPACSARQEVRGNTPKQYLLDQITPGKTTRQEVIKLIGTPTAVASFNQDQWYYIGQYRTRWAFFDSDVEDFSLVTIKFAKNNLVEMIKRDDKSALSEVEFNNKITPTEGTDPSVLKQLLGNIGKFNQQSQPK